MNPYQLQQNVGARPDRFVNIFRGPNAFEEGLRQQQVKVIIHASGNITSFLDETQGRLPLSSDEHC